MQDKYIELRKKAEQWIQAHRDEFVSELQGFARIPSVSRADLAAPGAPFGPDCRKVLDYALERGRHYGFDVKDHNGCAASITYGDGENALGIIAHLDVVPVSEGWKYPCFGATYLDEYDCLVGRGVSDNKAAAVMGLFAMRMLREFGWPMKHGIRLYGGMSEETGMQDMQMLLDQGERFPKLSLVPDAGFPVNYGQKGSVDAEIESDCQGNLVQFDAGSVRNVIPDLAECTVAADIEQVKAAMAKLDEADTCMLTLTPCEGGTKIAAAGKSGHAASPDSSDNAIQRLCRALTLSGILQGSCARAIKELCDLTADGYGQSEGVAYSDEISGALTLVYAVAHLKDGKLTASVDSRYSITCDGETLEKKLRENWAQRGYQVAHFEMTKPFYIPKDDPRVLALQGMYQEITGRDDQPYTMGGGTYSRVVPNAISFGPGLPGVRRDVSAFLPEGHGGAHGRDEVVFMESIHTCCMIYVLALAALDEIVD